MIDGSQQTKEDKSMLEPIVLELQTTRDNVMMEIQRMFVVMKVSTAGYGYINFVVCI